MKENTKASKLFKILSIIYIEYIKMKVKEFLEEKLDNFKAFLEGEVDKISFEMMEKKYKSKMVEDMEY